MFRVYRGLGIAEKNMETTRVYCGLYWDDGKGLGFKGLRG